MTEPGRAAPRPTIRLGISSCLLGDEVRFDGGHKRDRFLTDTLGPFVEWVRVCPEVELGLGTPRETLRLVKSGAALRMITTRTAIDHTDGMNSWAKRRVSELAGEDLCGYVLKKDSPSCGMERVKVYSADAVPDAIGSRAVRDRAARRGFRICRSRRRAACRTRGCARTSSSASSPTAA